MQQSPQQILAAQLTELPMMGLEQRIEEELIENPALERSEEEPLNPENDENELPETEEVSLNEGDSLLSDYAESVYDEEEAIPVRRQGGSGMSAAELARGQGADAFEQLLSQVRVLRVSEREREVLEVLVLFLDRGGLLRESTLKIREEMARYHNLTVGEEELHRAIRLLKTLEPRGIGAQTLRECFLMQVNSEEYKSNYKDLEREILKRAYADFMACRVAVLAKRFKTTTDEMRMVYDDMRRHLNPAPLGELQGDAALAAGPVVPDFMVREKEGNFVVRLNNGYLPELTVSQTFRDIVKQYSGSKTPLKRAEQDAYIYAKDKVDRAQGFIVAVRQRQDMLLATMKTIVEMQADFFHTGDETLLHPMILQDVAEKVGVDRSTISRVNNSKYVDTIYGIFPLKFFFHEGFKSVGGEEISKNLIRNELRKLIDSEQQDAPLSDDELAARLKEKGFDVARRTVAKYRGQMGIPVARLRLK